jgi:hypothetical protein
MLKDLAAGDLQGDSLNLALDVVAHGGSLREFFIGCPDGWIRAIMVNRTLTIWW